LIAIYIFFQIILAIIIYTVAFIAAEQEVRVFPSVEVAYRGSSVMLSCTANSKPVWTKGDLETFDYVEVQPYTGGIERIRIENLKDEDTNRYHCTDEVSRLSDTMGLYVGGEVSTRFK